MDTNYHILIGLVIFFILILIKGILMRKREKSSDKAMKDFCVRYGFKYLNKFVNTLQLKNSILQSYIVVPRQILKVGEGSIQSKHYTFFSYLDHNRATNVSQTAFISGKDLHRFQAIHAKHSKIKLPDFYIEKKRGISMGKEWLKLNQELNDHYRSTLQNKQHISKITSILKYMKQNKLIFYVQANSNGVLIDDHIKRFNPYTKQSDYTKATKLIQFIYNTFEVQKMNIKQRK